MKPHSETADTSATRSAQPVSWRIEPNNSARRKRYFAPSRFSTRYNDHIT